jgi:hypothetical protein
MWFEQSIVRRLLSNLTRSPAGCAFTLAQAAEAEAAGEALVFERLENHAPDKLKPLIRRHYADERAHAELLREAVQGCGEPSPVLSPELNIVHVLDRQLGGPLLSGSICSDEAAIRVYVIVELLERRAVREMGLLAEALAAQGRPEAKMLMRIRADEGRHIRYCRAALRLYGSPLAEPGEPPSALEREVCAEVREALAQYDVSTVTYLLDSGLLTFGTGPIERSAWRGLLAGLKAKVALRTRRQLHYPTSHEPLAAAVGPRAG